MNMNKLAAFAGFALLSCFALADPMVADAEAAFDPKITAAAERLLTHWRTQFGLADDGDVFPPSVVMTGADSRIGPRLQTSSVFENRRYIARLAARGVDRVLIRIGYPMFDASNHRDSVYQEAYKDIALHARRAQMEIVALVSLQPRDDQYLLSLRAPAACDDLLADHLYSSATTALEVLEPDYLVIDASPETLSDVAVCKGRTEPWQPEQLANVVLGVVERLGEDRAERIGIAVDLAGLPTSGFVERLLLSPASFFLSVASNRMPLDAPVWADSLAALGRITAQTQRRVASHDWWIDKRGAARALGIESDYKDWQLSDAAAFWSDFDQMAIALSERQVAGGWLFAVLAETDLLLGAYLGADEMTADGPSMIDRGQYFLSNDRLRVVGKARDIVEQEQRDANERAREEASR